MKIPDHLIAIHDRKKPGDYRVIARTEFDASRDVPFSEPLPSSDHGAQEPLGTQAAPVCEADQASGAATSAGSQPAAEPTPRTKKPAAAKTPKAAKPRTSRRRQPTPDDADVPATF